MKRKLLVVVTAALTFAAVCLAQRDRGTLTGIVTDNSGAVVPSVQLTITNTATNGVYKTATNDVGQYTMPNLPIGPYQMTFEATGFKTLVRADVELSQGQILRVDVTLEVGAVTEQVRVTAELSRLESETARVITSMPESAVRDLPMSFTSPNRGRTVEDWFYKVAPGIQGDTWSSSINGGGAGLAYTTSKETLFDGAPVATNLSGVITETSVSLEAVQEFTAQTSGYSAEYGRTTNGVFSYVLKSGTNEVHGSALGELRNEALNANTFDGNFFDLRRSQDRKTVYALTFGGPVYVPKVYTGKNRTFFYVAYEKYNQHLFGGGAPNRTYPLPEFYAGDFSRLLGPDTGYTDALGRAVVKGAIYDPATFHQLPNGRWVGDMFPGNTIPASRFSKVSQKINEIAKAHYLPTYRDPSGQIPLINNAIYPTTTMISKFEQKQFSVKMDQYISDKHKLSGSIDYNARPTLEPRGTQGDARGGMWDWSDPNGGPWADYYSQPYNTKRARIAEDWTISPRLFNHFMINANRSANPMTDATSGINGAQLYGIKGLNTTNYPPIDWGSGPYYPLSDPNSTFEWFQGFTTWGLQDNIAFSKGRHFMKAGWEYRNFKVCERLNAGGSFTFSPLTTSIPNEPYSGTRIGYSFASYLLGIVSNVGLTVPNPRSKLNYYHALFFQDDFKVRPNLTLNLGLRWEHQPPTYEAHDRISSWDPNVTDPLSGLPGGYTFAGSCSACTGRRYFGTKDWRNFGPRIGFAWQPRKGLSVRGAYTITYQGDDAYQTMGNAIAWGGSYNLAADPVNPWRGSFNWDDGLPQDRLIPATFNRSYADLYGGARMVDPKYGTAPYLQQWNLDIQKQLPWNVMLDVNYLSTRMVHVQAGQLVRLNQLPWSVVQQYGRNLLNTVKNAADAAANGVPYPYAGFNGTVASALRKYPQLRGNETVGDLAAPAGRASYDSLNIVVNRQFAKGLSIYANYVWSKNMNNTDGSPLDYYNLTIERNIASIDRPHAAKIFMQYELPVGRGKAIWGGAGRVASAILGGWSLSWIGNYFSGTPIGFSGSSPLPNGWNGGTNRANVLAGDLRFPGFNKANFDFANRATSSNNKYINTALISDPPVLTLGTGAKRYAQVRDFGTINEDIGLRKNIGFGDRVRWQLRAEFLNAFNRHNLSGINASVTSAQFGQVTGVYGNRSIQIGTRLNF